MMKSPHTVLAARLASLVIEREGAPEALLRRIETGEEEPAVDLLLDFEGRKDLDTPDGRAVKEASTVAVGHLFVAAAAKDSLRAREDLSDLVAIRRAAKALRTAQIVYNPNTAMERLVALAYCYAKGDPAADAAALESAAAKSPHYLEEGSRAFRLTDPKPTAASSAAVNAVLIQHLVPAAETR